MEKLLKFQKMIKELFADKRVLILPHDYHIEEIPEEKLNEIGYFKRAEIVSPETDPEE